MVRFIFVCMAVVALSVLSIAAQFLYNDLAPSRADIIARNEAKTTSRTAEATLPERLNAIETAAGFDPMDDFKGGFTNKAPRALEDAAPQDDAMRILNQ